MTSIQYDIIPRNGGWSIACGKVIGQPYYRKREAIGDAEVIAKILRATGDDVVVSVEGVATNVPSLSLGRCPHRAASSADWSVGVVHCTKRTASQPRA